MTGLSGCSYLFYPRAGNYAIQAKGSSSVETMINFANMTEATASKAKEGKGVDTAFDDVHNQFHALNDAFCGVTNAQVKTPTYDLAVTHKKELTAIFKRLWKFKDDQVTHHKGGLRCRDRGRPLRLNLPPALWRY